MVLPKLNQPRGRRLSDEPELQDLFSGSIVDHIGTKVTIDFENMEKMGRFLRFLNHGGTLYEEVHLERLNLPSYCAWALHRGGPDVHTVGQLIEFLSDPPAAFAPFSPNNHKETLMRVPGIGRKGAATITKSLTEFVNDWNTQNPLQTGP